MTAANRIAGDEALVERIARDIEAQRDDVGDPIYTESAARLAAIIALAVVREHDREHGVCPWDTARGNSIAPEEPCPVCGVLGTWDDDNLARGSNCVSRSQPPEGER